MRAVIPFRINKVHAEISRLAREVVGDLTHPRAPKSSLISVALEPVLESISKLPRRVSQSCGDEATGGQIVEGLKVFPATLVTHSQSAEMAEARQRALDDVADASQAAAVHRSLPAGAARGLPTLHEGWGDDVGCYKRTCWECETVFFSFRPHAQFCSPRCAKKLRGGSLISKSLAAASVKTLFGRNDWTRRSAPRAAARRTIESAKPALQNAVDHESKVRKSRARFSARFSAIAVCCFIAVTVDAAERSRILSPENNRAPVQC
ncbi:MAG: hypothetical protein QOE14_2019 [Humisphaera sp.]|nr:hypothetical protein [Humisphaera sp.]